MKKIKWLVAIPYFENSVYLKEAIDSLLAQTDHDFDLVVMDDSIRETETKGAKEVIQNLNHPKVRYHRNEKNLGLAQNWNQGLRLAREGKYDLLSLLHGDDRMKPTYLSAIGELFKSHPHSVGYFCKPEVIGSDGGLKFSFVDRFKDLLVPQGNIITLSGVSGIEKLIPGDFVFWPTVTYNVQKTQNFDFSSDYRQVLDLDYLFRTLIEGESWVGIYDQAHFQYRRHNANTTALQTSNLKRFHEEIGIYDWISEQLKAKGEIRVAQKAKNKTIIKLYLCFEIAKCALGFNLDSIASRLKLLVSLFKSKHRIL